MYMSNLLKHNSKNAICLAFPSLLTSQKGHTKSVFLANVIFKHLGGEWREKV